MSRSVRTLKRANLRALSRGENGDTLDNECQEVYWLAYLREPKRKGKAQTELDLTPIDVDAVRASAEREAMATVVQLVVMAKAAAATFMGEKRLAAELLDQVWLAIG